jgi:hypothetical protein
MMLGGIISANIDFIKPCWDLISDEAMTEGIAIQTDAGTKQICLMDLVAVANFNNNPPVIRNPIKPRGPGGKSGPIIRKENIIYAHHPRGHE